MIDTIKLVVKFDSPLRCKANFQPRIDSIREDYRGPFRAYANPSAADKKQGKYLPRLTYVQRPKTGFTTSYELAIELSLPKLLYNENFTELTDQDFPKLVKQLQTSLQEIGLWLFTHQIEQAEVRAIHFSKNFVFKDHTSTSSVLQMLRTADVSKRLDVQNTDFRNGGYVLHIHTNSMDIAFYDKIADLRQSKISEKRSQEKDNYVQLDILETIKRQHPIASMRYELRFNGKVKIKSALAKVGFEQPLTFENVYSADLSRRLLLAQWQDFYDNIPKLPLDTDEPDKLLANILQTTEQKGPIKTAAQLGMMLLLKDSDQRYVRTMFEERFGTHAWSSLKPLMRQPSKVQYKTLLAIQKGLEVFEPTKIEDIKDNI
ncbi:hypothetical protein IT414_01150 [bacterium]|nr:hypothetical protein [bacterium]